MSSCPETCSIISVKALEKDSLTSKSICNLRAAEEIKLVDIHIWTCSQPYVHVLEDNQHGLH